MKRTQHHFKKIDVYKRQGYRINQGNKSAGIATDLGYYDEYIVQKLSGLDVLLLEANHDVNMLSLIHISIDGFIKNVGEIYEKEIGYAADFYVVEIGDGSRRIA